VLLQGFQHHPVYVLGDRSAVDVRARGVFDQLLANRAHGVLHVGADGKGQAPCWIGVDQQQGLLAPVEQRAGDQRAEHRLACAALAQNGQNGGHALTPSGRRRSGL
jgi:hypothetical protein